MQGISVIIPVINRENYIGEAIESILEQDYDGPLEVIVSDDGSTDRTVEIAENYGEPMRVLRFPNGAMQGPAAARNRGIQAAKHPLVAFLDSDDIYLPGHLRDAAGYLASNTDVVMVIDRGFGMNVDGTSRWLLDYPTSDRVTAEMILLDGFFPLNAVVLRRSLLGAVWLFDEGLRMGEHQDLWLRIVEEHTVA